MTILRQFMILSLMLTLCLSFLVVNSSFIVDPIGSSRFAWSLGALCLVMMVATFYQMQRLSIIESKDTNQIKIDLILSSLELHKGQLDISSTDDDEIDLGDITIGPIHTDTNQIHLY